jgi:hypothetical protein
MDTSGSVRFESSLEVSVKVGGGAVFGSLLFDGAEFDDGVTSLNVTVPSKYSNSKSGSVVK